MNKRIHERLQWLNSALVKEVVGDFEVEERDSEGRARVKCSCRNQGIRFCNPADNRFPYINFTQKCADEVIFEEITDDQWVLHVIELKKTVKSKEWQKIKEQFEGAILQAHACMGVLGIPDIAEVRCYTAFRNNQITEQESPDPVLLKTAVGGKNSSVTNVDWLTDVIHLRVSQQGLKHHKIQLSTEGYGEVSL